MKVWITKYALTSGIIEKEADVYSKYPDLIDLGPFGFFHKPDWHETEAGAVARAEKMRVAKIAALCKQLDKLEKLSFATGDSREEGSRG